MRITILSTPLAAAVLLLSPSMALNMQAQWDKLLRGVMVAWPLLISLALLRS